MCLDRFCQRSKVITAFQATYQPAAAMRLGHGTHRLGQVNEILAMQPKRADRVGNMSIEAGADQNEFGPDLVGGFFESTAVQGAIIRTRGAVAHRDIECGAAAWASAGLAGGA